MHMNIGQEGIQNIISHVKRRQPYACRHVSARTYCLLLLGAIPASGLDVYLQDICRLTLASNGSKISD